MPSHNALKHDAGGKKGKLLCCKRIFDRIKGNLVEIQPKNHQNVQKPHFLQKVPGVNGLNKAKFEGQSFPICLRYLGVVFGLSTICIITVTESGTELQ